MMRFVFAPKKKANAPFSLDSCASSQRERHGMLSELNNESTKAMAEQPHQKPTPKGVIADAKKQGAKMVDVKFVDTFGTWQHFSVPISELTEEVFEEGFGFDGSSIRGWKSIEASDMLAMPDPKTAFIEPFCNVPTLSLTCTIDRKSVV